MTGRCCIVVSAVVQPLCSRHDSLASCLNPIEHVQDDRYVITPWYMHANFQIGSILCWVAAWQKTHV